MQAELELRLALQAVEEEEPALQVLSAHLV
jgi:hypothetical protein